MVHALFPYKGGLVGVWGYDKRQRKLRDPEAVGDFMGCCADHWISDFSYNKVLARFRSFSAGAGLGQALTPLFGPQAAGSQCAATPTESTVSWAPHGSAQFGVPKAALLVRFWCSCWHLNSSLLPLQNRGMNP